MPFKIQLLLVSLFATIATAVWVWRRRAELDALVTRTASCWQPVSIAILLVFGLAAWNGNAVYMADESVYRYSAAMYAEGLWSVPAPPIGSGPESIRPSEFQWMYLPVVDGRMFPMYPPGWPAVLAAASRVVPAPYVNPLLMAAILALAGFAARRWLPPGADAGTFWVLALSAMWTLNSAGFTSHVACAFWTAATATLAGLTWEKRDLRFAAAAFLCCSAVSLTRPMNGAICFGLTAAALAFRLGWKRSVLTFLPAGLVLLCISQWQNLATTGSWFVSGYDTVFASNNENIVRNVLDVIGKAIPRLGIRIADSVACSFPALAALVFAALLRRETRKAAMVLLLIAGAHILAYSVSPLDSDSPIGERYFQEAWIFVAIAAGLGWSSLRALAGRASWTVPLLACLLSAWSIASLTVFHHQTRSVSATLLAEKEGLADGVDLVFLKESALLHPVNYPLHSPRYWKDPVLFLPAPRPERRSAVAAALHRTRWREVQYTGQSPAFVQTAHYLTDLSHPTHLSE